MTKILIGGVDVVHVNLTFEILCVDILRDESENFAVRYVVFDDVFVVWVRICYHLLCENVNALFAEVRDQDVEQFIL